MLSKIMTENKYISTNKQGIRSITYKLKLVKILTEIEYISALLSYMVLIRWV